MPKHVIAVDVDHTLIQGNCSFLFGKFLWKQGSISSKAACICVMNYMLYVLGWNTIEQLHRVALTQIFVGKKRDDIERLVGLFFDRHKDVLFKKSMMQWLLVHQSQGAEIVLLSSSPDCLVKQVAHYVAAPGYMASTYAVNEQGVYTGDVCVLTGEDKAHYVCLRKQEAVVTAIGDSIEDVPMLEVCHHAIVVSPHYQLRKIAKTHNWQIME